MDILEIKKRFELLKHIYSRTYCDVPALARELGVKKTNLMDFIEQNPKLFDVEDGKKGLIIRDVFLKPEDNRKTEEWLKKKIEDNKMYIHIDEIDNYGRVVGYHILCDKQSNSHEDLWRNTEEKIKVIQALGVTESKTFYFGWIGDSMQFNVKYYISEEGIKELEKHGWSHNELHPIDYYK